MLRLLSFLLLVLSISLASADTIHEALVNLCDPAKIQTLSSERGANPRVRKITYWLEMARLDGRDPTAEMREVMAAVGWGPTAKGGLPAEAMVRNRVIAERLGCWAGEGITNLRSGKSAIVRTGPYAGDQLSVDHIIPRAVCPELDTTLANLELMPMRMNSSKNDGVGQRQVDMAKKFHDAGLLSKQGLDAVLAR